MKNFLSKYKKPIIVVAIIAVVVVTVVNLLPTRATENFTMAMEETGTVERRDLVESISASGTVQSNNSREVFANLTGVEVKEIFVEVGDYVAEGDLICEFDTEDLEESLADVRASLNASQGKSDLTLTDSQRSLSEAQTTQGIETERAKADTNDAYYDLEEAYADETEAYEEYENAKSTTAEKLAEYERYTEKATEASDQMKNAEKKRTAAQSVFTDLVNKGTTEIGWKSVSDLKVTNEGWSQLDWTGFKAAYVADNTGADDTKIEDFFNDMQAQAIAYQQANSEYNQASASYQSASTKASEFQQKYNNAVTAEKTAETAHETAKKGIETAQSTLESKQRSEEDTLRNQASTVAGKESSLSSTQLDRTTTGQSEKNQIKSYEQQIQDAKVHAPFQGVITNIALEEGQSYNGTTIFTIEDDSAYIVSAQIEEYDISKVVLGQRVAVKVEGAGNEEMDGTVTYIAPRADSGNSSAVKYNIEVSIDTPNDNLRMDMTAKISIIIKEVTNVLAIPYNGLQEDEDGNYFIEVAEQSDTTKMPEQDMNNVSNAVAGQEVDTGQMPMPSYRKIYVETGAENAYYVEVISDELKEGMEVRLSSSSNNNDAMSINMGMGRMGGF